MNSNISTKAEISWKGRLHLPQCQSTNDELLELHSLNRAGLPEGFVLSTDFQSAGRGQRGSRWEAEPGKNLLFSVLLRPDFLEPRFAFRLTAAISTGIVQALDEYHPNLRIKWPNDLFAGDCKLGGMLIETSISGEKTDRAVCGIGLNINQTAGLPASATSLKLLTGPDTDREILMKKIYSCLMQQYEQLKAGEWAKIRSAYLARLYRLAEPSWYRNPDGERFRATLKSISEEGELILVCADGEKRFRFKEVIFEPSQSGIGQPG